jgi:hypothetical protein
MGGEIAVAADVPLNSLLLILKWVLSKLSGSVGMDSSGSGQGLMVGSCEHGKDPSDSM